MGWSALLVLVPCALQACGDPASLSCTTLPSSTTFYGDSPGETIYASTTPNCSENSSRISWNPEAFTFSYGRPQTRHIDVEPDPWFMEFAWDRGVPRWKIHENAPLGAHPYYYHYQPSLEPGQLVDIRVREGKSGVANLEVLVAPSDEPAGFVRSEQIPVLDCGPFRTHPEGEDICLVSFPVGSAVTLAAVPTVGYQCGGWAGAGCTADSSDPTGCRATVDTSGPASCEVTFTSSNVPTAWLTVDQEGSGSGRFEARRSGGDLLCERTETKLRCPVQSGDVVTVEAEPNLGSNFVSWSGACSGTERITTVTMGATDAQCTARFDSFGEARLSLGLNAPAESEAVLSFTDGAGEAQTCRSSRCEFGRNLPPGTQVLIQASFADDPSGRGWRVVEWYGECTGDGNQAGIILGEGDNLCYAAIEARP